MAAWDPKIIAIQMIDDIIGIAIRLITEFFQSILNFFRRNKIG